MQDIESIASNFASAGKLLHWEPFAGGHINDSYLLSFQQSEDRTRRLLLQRINEAVFLDPLLVMDNVQRVTAHILGRLRSCDVRDLERRVLTLWPAADGAPYYCDKAGSCWRLYTYIENTQVFESAQNPQQAEQAGRAFGAFQNLLIDLPGPRLHETIPDFHNTKLRFDALERAARANVCDRAKEVRPEIEFADRHHWVADVLPQLLSQKKILERVVHNDAKISTVLFDNDGREALCVVDLATVMPGLALYDFGDMVRSMTSLCAEDEIDLAQVEIDLAMFAALTRGYLAGVGELLNAVERSHLVFAGKLITVEQGVRFLTDFLQGDTYYKTDHPSHNLDRCRTQFKLADSINRRESEMLQIVQEQ